MSWAVNTLSCLIEPFAENNFRRNQVDHICYSMINSRSCANEDNLIKKTCPVYPITYGISFLYNRLTSFDLKIYTTTEDLLLNAVKTSYMTTKWKLDVLLLQRKLSGKNSFCKLILWRYQRLLIFFSRVKVASGKYMKKEVTLKLKKQCCPELYWINENFHGAMPYKLCNLANVT